MTLYLAPDRPEQVLEAIKELETDETCALHPSRHAALKKVRDTHRRVFVCFAYGIL